MRQTCMLVCPTPCQTHQFGFGPLIKVISHLLEADSSKLFAAEHLEQNNTPSNAYVIDLDALWVDAHKNKDNVIDNEKVQEVTNCVVTLKEKELGGINKAMFFLTSMKDAHMILITFPSLIIVTNLYVLNNVWGINTCKLYLDIPSKRVVGVGKVHNLPDAMLHNALYGDALLPIPLDEDTLTVAGAIGTYVTWPINLIDVVPMM
ncbi:hypothetical protein Lal_00015302 [Lupinus albus]|nr:hypothetical protein Lal_00015302 [Lupinus albus]